MARTINQIQQQIITQKNGQSALNSLNSPSQTSIWNLWTYIMAVAIFVQESLWDLFQTQLETQIANAPAWTDQWIQSQAFLFQYDATTPQILNLVNFVPTYPVVDTTKQIISRCSVTTLPNKIVKVKVATNNPPQALNSAQLTSFQGYLSEITAAGVQYNAVSFSADNIYINAQILYNGQYASTIQGSVISSINNYLANIPFDGYIRVSSLEEAILATTGVNDVIINNLAIRPASTPFAQTTYMVQNNTEIYNKYPQYAGYSVTETTIGYTINDSLTFTVGS